MNSYVHIRLGKKRSVSKIRYGTDAPFYNEYFVFEFKQGLERLLDQHLTLTVYRAPTCCKLKRIMGYITVDISTIWEETDHQFYEKWAILTSPKSRYSGSMGFIKVTLSVLGIGEAPKIPVSNPTSDRPIEENLLLPEGITERRRALFIFKIYRGLDIIKKKHDTTIIEYESTKTDDKTKSLPNVTMRITFAGLSGKISTKKRTCNPIWNESLTISELYPPLSTRIRIDLIYQHKERRVVSVKKYIHLYSLCNYIEPKSFLPSFGPTFIHFYKKLDMGEEYAGKVLMQLTTKVFSDVRTKTVTTFLDGIPPIFDNNLWNNENIFLFATVASVSVIDKRYAHNNISFELNWGRLQTVEDKQTGETIVPHVSTPKYPAVTQTKEFWNLDFQKNIPCMHITHFYPSLMRRMYRTNQIDKIVMNMAEKLKAMKVLFKADVFVSHSSRLEEHLNSYFDYVMSACKKFYDFQKVAELTFETTLDINKTTHILDEMKDIAKICKTAYQPKMKKKSFRTAEELYLRVIKLIKDPQECWPNIYFWMKTGKNKRECLKFKARDIIYSPILEQTGKYCGQLNNFYFMTNKYSKSPIVCKIELFLWLGRETDRIECFHAIPNGFKVPDEIVQSNYTEMPTYLELSDFLIFNCRVHIYQGRFILAFDYTGLSDFFTRVIINDQTKQTTVKSQTLNPIWNETLILRNIICYGTKEEIEAAPPAIVLEVNDKDKLSVEYVGFSLVTPVIKFKEEGYVEPKFPPQLKWHKVKIEGKIVGELLAAVEFLEQTGNQAEDESYLSNENFIAIPAEICPIMMNYKFEILLWGVRHLKRLHHLQIRSPNVIIECNNYKFKSEIATIESINFSNNLFKIDMSLPMITYYIPPIMMKLFDERSMGRQNIYAGTHISYIQEFLYRPITGKQYKTLMALPKSTSMESMASKTDSVLEKELSIILRKRKREQKRKYRMWVLHSFLTLFSCTTICKACKSCMKYSWRGFKKTLRFICCLLLCCGCGRMFKKKKHKLKSEIEPPKYYRTKDAVIDMDTDDVERKDWWSKYFNSLGDPLDKAFKGLDKIKIYDNELELQSQFNNFQDVFSTYNFYRGKTVGDEHIDEKAKIGSLKCKIRAYKWSDEEERQDLVTPLGKPLKDGYFQNIPSNEGHQFVVRIYCIRAIKLRPLDAHGTTDTYIHIKMNNKVIDDRKNYVANNCNPIYGRLFELEGAFPRDHTVIVSVYDWDKRSRCDLIGLTKIDIENRFYSRHHAYCGIPKTYTLFGETPWRDKYEPTEILANLCEGANIPQPIYVENRVFVGNKWFDIPLSQEEQAETDMIKKEIQALYVLRRWNQIPIVGFHLVPEHVETRSLFHPHLPGIEQGKLQLWIDIFPVDEIPLPHQVNIRKRAPVGYELRVIIWNTENVLLNEDDYFGGDRKSDIYVKGWMTRPHEAQQTDVHYRSFSGEGNFNWRFVFRFNYLSAENMIVDKPKSGIFGLEGAERKLPCRLLMQVWDNDVFSEDDFLGSLTLYLNRMPRGAKIARQCTLKTFEKAPRVNLFQLKRTRGWWPFESKHSENHKQTILAGKLEAEFELLTTEQARMAPAGLGRSQPQPLPVPKRPETSFNWFFNPWKTFRYIIWKNLKWKLLTFLAIVLAGLFVALFFYSVPGYSVKYLFHV